MQEMNDTWGSNKKSIQLDDEELKRSIVALSDLTQAVRQATGQLALTSNLYSEGAKHFLSLVAKQGAVGTRVAAVRKALDQETSDASLRRFLGDHDLESAS